MSSAAKGAKHPLLKFFVAVFILAALAITIYWTVVFGGHNFHIVSQGKLYRSGQLNSDALAQVIEQNGIKSVLNLRGRYIEGWYIGETNTAQRLGAQHYDFELDAGTELKDAEMDNIITLLATAPKPVLIHCKNGADRTGLVGALYLYAVEGKSPDEAREELGLARGHIPYLFWRKTVAMDHSFSRYIEHHAPGSAATNNSSSPFTAQKSGG